MPKKQKESIVMSKIHVLHGPLSGFVVIVDEDQKNKALEGKWAVEYGSVENPAAGMSAPDQYAMLDAAYTGAEELKDAEKFPHESMNPTPPNQT
jgi:hypothetical protein